MSKEVLACLSSVTKVEAWASGTVNTVRFHVVVLRFGQHGIIVSCL